MEDSISILHNKGDISNADVAFIMKHYNDRNKNFWNHKYLKMYIYTKILK
ncbi:hypothetical protein JCM19029_20860 [Salinicoccus sesuvii]